MAKIKDSNPVKSALLKVTLDRKAPEIVFRQPPIDATNVNLADAIIFELSETINLANLDSHIQISDSNQTVLATTLEYSDHSIIVKLKDLPLLPNSFKLTITNLSDLAGNRLDASWSWSAPLWQSYGQALNLNRSQNAQAPVVIFDPQHHPVVAWIEDGHVYVKTYKNQQWELIGDKLNQSPASAPALIATDNSLVISWAEGEGQANIYVKEWRGQVWKNLGDPVDYVLEHDAAAPTLALDNQGRLLISFFEYDGQSSNTYVKRWNGTVWEALGSALDNDLKQNAVFPSITVVEDQPVVSWFERVDENAFVYVKRWNGQEWQLLGQALNQDSSQAFHPKVITDAQGRLLVTWFEFKNNYSVYVKRWDSYQWAPLGKVLNILATQSAAYPVIAANQEQLFVSWFERDPTSDVLGLKKWDNGSWQTIEAPKVSSTAFATYPSLALDGVGTPVLAWQESDQYGQGSLMYVQRYNGLLP